MCHKKSISIIIIALSIIGFISLSYLNYKFFHLDFSGSKISNKIIYEVVLSDTVFVFCMALPLLGNIFDKASSLEQNRFLSLPDQKDKLNIKVFISFLSEQALGGFLGSFIIYSTKFILHQFGPIIAALVTCFVFIHAIVIMSLSLARFINYFIRYGWTSSFISAVYAFAVMISFFFYGLNTAL